MTSGNVDIPSELFFSLENTDRKIYADATKVVSPGHEAVYNISLYLVGYTM